MSVWFHSHSNHCEKN